MAIGAGYAGRVAVTGSSGPGISLKTEALGWAVMAEVPLVIVRYPTRRAFHRHADQRRAIGFEHRLSSAATAIRPRVVLAPANVEDCFYTAIEAVNIARKYNVPVFILSDQAIATRIEAFAEPDLEKVCQDISPDLTPVPDHKPYDLSAPDGVTRHVAPGHAHHERQISDRDRPGARRDGPSDRLAEAAHADDGQAPQEIAGAGGDICRRPRFMARREGNVLLVGWGSTQGPIREAVDRARAAGDSVSVAAHPTHQPAADRAWRIFSPASITCSSSK